MAEPGDNLVSTSEGQSGRYLIRQEMELNPLPLLKWLTDQTSETKIYWACRQGDLEIVAIGCVDSIDAMNTVSIEQAFAAVEARLKQSARGIRYYGGQCFDPENLDLSQWHGFGPYRFIVPEYEIIRNDKSYTLFRNVRVDSDPNTEPLKQPMRDFVDSFRSYADQPEERSAQRNPSQMSRKDVPCQSEWIETAQKLIETIQSQDVEKVVLAQKADLVFSSAFNPIELLDRIKTVSLQAYLFLFQFVDSGTFLGASPECLFRKDGKELYSEAIAGTRAVNRDHAINVKLQDQLRQSTKDQQEHGYVVDDIQTAMETICDDVTCAESNQILQTASVQHLYTRFQGKLSDHINIHRIINALHPTAAVNGIPSDQAAEKIRLLEPFSRGWYAGPVGWIMSDQAEFSVAIRSALVQPGGMMSVYSGAGLVKDSDPEQEWAETELKKQLILNAAAEITR